jgi:hypothetical protein
MTHEHGEIPGRDPGGPGKQLGSDHAKGWNVLLRLYGPLEPWFDKSWKPGDIEPVQ